MRGMGLSSNFFIQILLEYRNYIYQMQLLLAQITTIEHFIQVFIIFMDQILQITIKLRDKFLHACLDYLEPGYYILANKTNPLSKEEAEFKDIYANVFSLHCLSLVFSIPSGVSYYHYFRASRKVPVDTKRVAWARRRLVVFMPLSLAFCFTGYIYESTHNLRNRLMAIEQFYQDHKEEDLNTISFEPQYLQRK